MFRVFFTRPPLKLDSTLFRVGPVKKHPVDDIQILRNHLGGGHRKITLDFRGEGAKKGLQNYLMFP